MEAPSSSSSAPPSSSPPPSPSASETAGSESVRKPASFGRKVLFRGGLALLGSSLAWLYYQYAYARRLPVCTLATECAEQDSKVVQSLGEQVPYPWYDVRGAVLAAQWKPAALPWSLVWPEQARCTAGEQRAVVSYKVRGALTAATVTATAVQRTDGRAAWQLQKLTVTTYDGRRETVIDRTPLLPNHV